MNESCDFYYCGRGEIRTHGTLASPPVFKTGALNHSATLPYIHFVHMEVAIANRDFVVLSFHSQVKTKQFVFDPISVTLPFNKTNLPYFLF